MSADNWTYCPRCTVRVEAEAAEREQKAKDAYGKVSAEEYLALLAEAKRDPDYEETLREDYEIGVRQDRHGEGPFLFDVTYTAWCSICGWSYKYEFTDRRLKLDDDNQTARRVDRAVRH